MSDSADLNKRQTSFKLFVLVLLMFGFGFLLVPFYEAICEATGINVLAAREKVDPSVLSRESNTQVDKSRKVSIEFDSNSHGPWKFVAEKPFIDVHPGELVTVNFFVTNPSTQSMSGQAIPSYAPLNASGYLKKIECFCFQQQKLEAGETKKFPVVFVVDNGLPDTISNITMSYTFFDLLSSYSLRDKIYG